MIFEYNKSNLIRTNYCQEPNGQNNHEDEFKALKELFDNYQKSILKTTTNYQNKDNYIRLIGFLVPVALSFPLKQYLGYLTFILWGISASFSILVIMVIDNTGKLKTRLHELKIKFLLEYKCPHCHGRLGEIDWRLLLDQQFCPNCKKKLVNEISTSKKEFNK
jgi:hypothetical protein